MSDTIYEVIGERIRATRKARGLTQEVLAERAGIDRSHMGFIEQGRRHPTISTLAKIAKVLDIPLANLLRGF